VADALRERIDGGEWLPGEALPSLNALAEAYGVSRSTAARAVKVLTDEGRVTVTPGWGTFIAER
jgi:GntR family transcriptional regulator